jgi:hypothetical protein
MMQIIEQPNQIIYIASSGDWRILVEPNRFVVLQQFGQPVAGEIESSSGQNLTNLAELIIAAQAHATGRGINWQGD